MNETDLTHLRTSIELAWKARERGNHPFGAVLANTDGLRLLIAENTVSTERDVTCHAELNLVRLATHDLSAEQLTQCTLYASTEPCAMCAGAAFWAGIGRVVYALAETDLYALIGHSAGQLVIPCREVFARAGRATQVEGPCAELGHEAHAVHAGVWKRRA